MTGNEFDDEISDLRRSLESKETDELYEIWDEYNKLRWSDQTFELIEEILKERNIDIPEKGAINTCGYCNKPLIANAEYCHRCGEFLREETVPRVIKPITRNCVTCNLPVPSDARFCPYCGKKDPSNLLGKSLVEWIYKTVQVDDIFKPGLGMLLHGDTNSFDVHQINEALNLEGNDCWELVNAVPTIGAEGSASKLLFFFKKQKI